MPVQKLLSFLGGTFLLISNSSGVLLAQTSPEVRPPIQVRGQTQSTVVGLTPAQVRRAYGFDQLANGGAGQIIAIVDAYDHPHIESDLKVFSAAFALKDCDSSNGCFQKVYASGRRPGFSPLWALEIALDVEWAHAIAPDARILLVEARSSHLDDMLAAVDKAVEMGASVISMSWGAPEFSDETLFDNHFLAAGVMFVASSGDSGTGTLYPSVSSDVLAVGGTTLNITPDGTYLDETAWSGSGGGQSVYEVEPAFQYTYGIPDNPQRRRGTPDVAYDADPDTGFAVYDSAPFYGFSGWIQVAGTSAGAPQWSALIAIANASRAEDHKGPLSGNPEPLYAAAKTGTFHDVTRGTNGDCGTLCTAAPGYDYVTGLGSPQADRLVPALVKKP
jgi:subtilase family serine protease